WFCDFATSQAEQGLNGCFTFGQRRAQFAAAPIAGANAGIIRARNQHRRQLRTTLADREATIEALLALRRGQELDVSEPLLPDSEASTQTSVPVRPRLKRYFNDE